MAARTAQLYITRHWRVHPSTLRLRRWTLSLSGADATSHLRASRQRDCRCLASADRCQLPQKERPSRRRNCNKARPDTLGCGLRNLGRSSLHRRRLYRASCWIMSEAFSAIMIVGAFVLPEVKVGMIEASTTRRPDMPLKRRRSSTTDTSSWPILQVPTG